MKPVSIVLLAGAILGLSATVALAKRGSIGIYAIVDTVELQPNDEAPERILMRGVFVVPVPLSSGKYLPPQRGYLYFALPREAESVAVQEWRQLKDHIGTGRGFGFAPYWEKSSYPGSFESLRVQVLSTADGVVPREYPQPRGIVATGDKNDPDFDAIVGQLNKAALDSDSSTH
jgi:hypothetical protein